MQSSCTIGRPAGSPGADGGQLGQGGIVMPFHDRMRAAARSSQRLDKLRASLLTAALMSAASSAPALAAGDPPPDSAPAAESSNAALLKKLQVMEQRIKTLETERKQASATPTV